ncbi:uncharacterized protein [Hetaerina americana]|uniref:uncharacterized protein n=1 Tax=Hetaerina americana TaxID=62018 RepID=UPI003A7F3037
MYTFYAMLYLHCILGNTVDGARLTGNWHGRTAYSKHNVLSSHPSIDRSSAFPGSESDDVIGVAPTAAESQPAVHVYSISEHPDEADPRIELVPPNYEDPPSALSQIQQDKEAYDYNYTPNERYQSFISKHSVPETPFIPMHHVIPSSELANLTPKDDAQVLDKILEKIFHSPPSDLTQYRWRPRIPFVHFPWADGSRPQETESVTAMPRLQSLKSSFNYEYDNRLRSLAKYDKTAATENSSTYSLEHSPHPPDPYKGKTQQQSRISEKASTYTSKKHLEDLLEYFMPPKTFTLTRNRGDVQSDYEDGMADYGVEDHKNLNMEFVKTLEELKSQGIWNKFAKLYQRAKDNVQEVKSRWTSNVAMNTNNENKKIETPKRESNSAHELYIKEKNMLLDIKKIKDEILKILKNYVKQPDANSIKFNKGNNWFPYFSEGQDKKLALRSATPQDDNSESFLDDLKEILSSIQKLISPQELKNNKRFLGEGESISMPLYLNGKVKKGGVFATTSETSNYLDFQKLWPSITKSQLDFSSSFSGMLIQSLQNLLKFLKETIDNSPTSKKNRNVEMSISEDLMNLPPGSVESIEAGGGMSPGKHEGGGIKIMIHKPLDINSQMK